MNLQPFLENKLIRIRPLRINDLEPMYTIAKDPRIWEQHPCDRYKRTEFERFFSESIQSKGALTILDQQTNQVIGSSRFKRIKGFQNGIEIGWSFLDRSYWGGATNKVVKGLMIQYAFSFIDHILFYVAKSNVRSQKAVEKIGAQKINPSTFPMLPRKGEDTLTFMIKKTEYMNMGH